MQPAVILMIASVGAVISGCGRSSRRMSPGAWIVVTSMAPILPAAETAPDLICEIRSWGDGLPDPDRHPDPQRPAASRVDPAAAGRRAQHQPECGEPDRAGPPERLPGDA